MTSFPVHKKRGYLGNGYSYKKSYYWTLIGSWGRPFRIRYKKVKEPPPSGEINMTSFPVHKKRGYLGNGYSYKKSYYWTLIGSWGRPFKIRYEKVKEPPPSGEISMTSFPVHKKRDYLGSGYSYMKSYYWTLIGSWGRPFRICNKKIQKPPPSGEVSMTSFPVCKSTYYLKNGYR